MTLPLAVFWIIVVSLFGALGAWYARRYNRPDALIAFYVTLVVFANIAVSKTIAFDFGFAQFFAPATVLIFSVTFLLTDIINEKFGKKETQRMILIALFSQIALVLFSYLVLQAQGAPFFQNQAAFESLLSNVPRIVIASLISFYVSENVDAHLFHWFKKLTGGKHLWVRNAFSSIPSMLLDSALFITLAFYGTMPITPLIVGLSATKWLVGVIDIPFMYLSRAILGQNKSDAEV
jgi:hypothetical protein